jgi:hypothetical protein
MTAWSWGDRNFHNHSGDTEWLLREALRRAVDIRDVDATQTPLAARPVILVDVLNALKRAMGFDAGTDGADWLWSETE